MRCFADSDGVYLLSKPSARSSTERLGSVVGLASVGLSRDDDERRGATGELYALYLDPANQRCDVGRCLQAAALNLLVTRGFADATLRVLAERRRATVLRSTGWGPDEASKTEARGDVLLREVRYRRVLAAPLGDATLP
jgi:GNAT superfamily N-acetyltransferase